MSRTDRLVELLRARELDSLLVSDLLNVRYLTGFTGTNGACVVTPEERLFFTDFRYVEQAREQVPEYERIEAGRDMLADVAGRLSGRAGFDDEHLSVAAHRKLSEKLPDGVELVPAGGLVEELRAVKDASEVASMRAAAELATAAYESLHERGLAGRTERDVALQLVRFMEDSGAEGPSFPPIVAAGEHGARPHAVPRDVEIPRDTLVVIDMGAMVDGYCSDCTRTLATGSLDDGALEIYELVRRAQAESLVAARAGAANRDVDAVAREIIDAAGHEEHFGHGLGHGVGLEVHEAPAARQDGRGRAGGGQRRDHRARCLRARPGGRADRGPRDRDRRRARDPHGVPEGTGHSRLMLLAALAALLGAAVQSATGFGFALVLSPALFAVMEPTEAVTALLLLGAVLNVLVLLEGHDVRWPLLPPLILPAVPGLALGAALLGALSREPLQIGVGLAVIAAALWQLRDRGVARRLPAAVAGFTSGVLTTSISISGPPLVLWLEAQSLRPAEFRATLAALFLALNVRRRSGPAGHRRERCGRSRRARAAARTRAGRLRAGGLRLPPPRPAPLRHGGDRTGDLHRCGERRWRNPLIALTLVRHMSNYARTGRVRHSALVVAAILGPLALGATDAAASKTVTAGASVARPCHRDIASSATGRALLHRRAPARAIVSVRLRSGGDWDVAVFGRRGRLVAGSASFGGNELAEGFVRKGERLTVQACRFRGSASSARLGIDFTRLAKRRPGTVQVVDVITRRREDRDRLQTLGLDLTEHGDANSVEVVLHGSADAQKLRARGLPLLGPDRGPGRADAPQPPARRAARSRLGRVGASERARRLPPAARLRPRHEAARDAVPVAGAADHAEPQQPAGPRRERDRDLDRRAEHGRREAGLPASWGCTTRASGRPRSTRSSSPTTCSATTGATRARRSSCRPPAPSSCRW